MNPVSLENLQLESVLERFLHWEKSEPNAPFLRQPYGKTWNVLSYKEAGGEIRRVAQALRNMGLKKGDHVAILSKNCYHWVLADLAIIMAQMVSVPFYPSLPKNQLEELVDKSDIKAIFLGKLEKWGDRASIFQNGIKCLRFPHYSGNAQIKIGTSWSELQKTEIPEGEDQIPNIEDLWTILFTSGTTGSPKGVMHNHKNAAIIFAIEDKYQSLHLREKGRFFSYLPLNHVAERVGIMAAAIHTGSSISFGESIDTFAQNLQDTQPTFFLAVPRIWIKFQEGVLGKLSQKKLNFLLSIPFVSGKVKNKIKHALGLSEVRTTLTGAALTPLHVKEWYAKLGIHLREVYGMTEACGSVTLSKGDSAIGENVGHPLPHTEVRIDPDSGELQYFSSNPMLGYYKNPEKTSEVLKDGWINSGDQAEISPDGSIVITGRVSDSFKTSKGKYITPSPLEMALSKNEYIEQVCVAGISIPQPIAMVNLTESAARFDKSTIAASLENSLQEINQDLANYQKISTIVVKVENWTEDNQLLTPTLKIRRKEVDRCFRCDYLRWHETDEKIVWD